MSRILRRPMFRGGRVSAYGTGIAAPLVPGYQGGGQIGGGIIYGKPMADGRYGFQNVELFDVKDAIGEIETGQKITDENVPKINDFSNLDFTPEKTQEYYLEEEAVKDYVPKYQTPEDFENAYQEKLEALAGDVAGYEVDSWGMTRDREGRPLTGLHKEYDYLQTADGKATFMKKLKDEQDAKIKEVNKYRDKNLKVTNPVNGTGQEKELTADQLEIDRLNKIIAGEEKPEVDARTAVAENKALFADLLGIDKARGQDFSEMLLGWAGAEGDDTWSKTKSFFKDEAKRPGRRRKISDAAGTLAIQDYVAGKRSKEQIEKLKQVETFKMDEQLKRIYPQADDDWLDAIRKGAGKDGSISSDTTITKALAPRARAEGKSINPSLTKTTLEEVNKDQDDFKIGYTIVTLSKENGRKVIIERTATDIKVREDLPVF